MRAATLADSEPLAAFYADLLRMQDATEPQASLAEWTRDVVAGFLATLDASAATRHVLHVPRDAAQWHYEMTGHRPGSAAAHVICVIEDATTARQVGAVAHGTELWSSGTLGITMLEVAAGV